MGESKFDNVQQRISTLIERIGREYERISNDSNLCSPEWLRHLASCSSKSDVISRNLRRVADRFRENGNYEDSLRTYNESLASANSSSVESVQAMINRSRVLFEMKNYVACLADVDRALEVDCSPDEKAQLRARKADCAVEIKRINKMKSEMLLSYRRSRRSTNNDVICDVIEKCLKPISFTNNGGLCDGAEPIFDSDSCDTPPAVFEPKNEFIPNASAKIRVDYDFQYGRHIIASEDIETGDTILFEDPFAWYLNNNWTKTHCSCCFIRSDALIPCDRCSFVMYCGESCRNRAQKLYHRVECQILGSWNEIVNFNCFDLLALRTTLTGLKQGNNMEALKDDMNLNLRNFSARKTTWVNESLQNDYVHAVCNLARCSNDQVDSDLVVKCAYLLYGLKCVSFFGDPTVSVAFSVPPKSSTSLLTREQTLFGIHLVGNYYAILCNPYNVYETVLDQKSNVKMNSNIGSALYIFASLINHSCDPNCSYYFVRNRIIFYANRPIIRGEQIFTSYGPLFSSANLKERELHLKQYGFQCQCNACQMNWPTLDNVSETARILSNKSLTSVAQKLKTLKNELQEIEWNPANLNAHNELLHFHRKFSTLIHDNFEKPWIWFISSVLEIEKLMDMNGNLCIESNDTVKIIEILVLHALDTDVRQWFTDLE